MINSPFPSYEASEFLTSWNDEDIKGSGSFACVRKCEHKQLGEVAVKCFKITGSRQKYKKAVEEIEREINVLFRLDHKTIVQILGVTRWSNNIGIIMECMDGGNLEDLLMSIDVPDIPLLLRLRFFHDIADGLSHIRHYDVKKAFVHSDLKPQNILLTPDMMLKIADFGSVNITLETNGASASLKMLPSTQLTAFYAAPEVLKILRSRKILQWMFTGQKPDVKLPRGVEKSLEGKPQDLEIFKFLENLIIKCWEYKPEKRPDSLVVRNETNKKLRSLAASRYSYHINDLRLKNKSVDKPQTTNTIKIELNNFHFPFKEGPVPLSHQTHMLVADPKVTTSKMQDLTLKGESSRGNDEQLLIKRKPQLVSTKLLEEHDNNIELVLAKINRPTKASLGKATKQPVPVKQSLRMVPQTSKDQHENNQAEKASETLMKQIQKFSNRERWVKDDKLQLLSLWVQLYELKNSSLMKRAAEYFPSTLNLLGIRLNEIQVRAFSEILKFTNKSIEEIGLWNCQLRSSLFRQISTALLESSSTVGELNIGGNRLDGVEDVVELIPRVSHKMSLFGSFTGGRGG